MSDPIESYKLSNIRVTIEEADHPDKLRVTCNDGTFQSQFTISRYEYKNYKRHMNQRIKNAYQEEYGKEN